MDISGHRATKLLEALENQRLQGRTAGAPAPQGAASGGACARREDALNARRIGMPRRRRRATLPVDQPADGSSGPGCGVPEEAVGRPQVSAPEWRTADVRSASEFGRSRGPKRRSPWNAPGRLHAGTWPGCSNADSSGGNASVAELYRLQYLVGMLRRVQATSAVFPTFAAGQSRIRIVVEAAEVRYVTETGYGHMTDHHAGKRGAGGFCSSFR